MTFVDFSPLYGIEDKEEMRQTAHQLLDECKHIADKRIHAEITANKIQPKDLISLLPTLTDANASYIVAGKRKIATKHLELAANRIMHCSCHKMLFGEDKTVYLPRHLGVFVAVIAGLKADEKRDVFAYVRKYYLLKAIENGGKPTDAELLRARFQELAADAGISTNMLRSWKPLVKDLSREREVIDWPWDILPNIFKSNASISVSGLMSICVAFDISADYLACRDYTANCPIEYARRQEDGKDIFV